MSVPPPPPPPGTASASVSLMHDAGVELLERLIRLARSATAFSPSCRKLGLALSKPSLPDMVKFICALAAQPGTEDTDVYEDLLDELDDLFSQAEYWLLSCQPALAEGHEALHRDAGMAARLAELEVAVKALTAFDRERMIVEDVKELARVRVRERLRGEVQGSRSLTSTPSLATSAAGSLAGDALSDQGGPSVQHGDDPDGIDELLRRLHESATLSIVRPAGVPELPAHVFQHSHALLPLLLQQVASRQQLGIAGPAGIGKTTLALAVFDAVREGFSPGCCFFLRVGHGADPRRVLQRAWRALLGGDAEALDLPAEELAHKLARQLHGQRVLLVLDDVLDAEVLKFLNFAQLEGHAEHQLENRVIVTTRDPAILGPQPDAKKPWTVVMAPALTADNARRLLCWHAFGTEAPPEGFEGVAQDVLHHAQGLPLVLQVIGAELRGRPVSAWAARLRALAGTDTSGTVTEQLRRRVQASVDALPPFTRRCFTVFAAFEEDAHIPGERLLAIFSGVCPFQASDAWAREQLDLLLSAGLVSMAKGHGADAHERAFSKREFFMHDLLRDLACLEVARHPHTYEFSCARSPCSDLQPGSDVPASVARVVACLSADQTVACCAPVVRVLSAGRTVERFVLDGPTPHSSMRVLNLKECAAMDSLPAAVLMLLVLQRLALPAALGCVPDAIAQLQRLRHLDVGECSSLTALPESIGELKQLRQLNLRGCEALRVLPESVGKLLRLELLNLRACGALAALPESIGSLSELVQLNLRECESLETLPESIGQLTKLQQLNLRECESLAALPDSIGRLTQLQRLRLGNCESLTALPGSIGQLTQLQVLDLLGCRSLTAIPDSIGRLTQLQSLVLEPSTALSVLPDSIGQLVQLQQLDLAGCDSLTSLPESIGDLAQLRDLAVKGCSSLRTLPESIGQLERLQRLVLQDCSSLSALPQSIGQLEQLQNLILIGCDSLTELPESVGQLEQLDLWSF